MTTARSMDRDLSVSRWRSSARPKIAARGAGCLAQYDEQRLRGRDKLAEAIQPDDARAAIEVGSAQNRTQKEP
jgi:hypothetical protein